MAPVRSSEDPDHWRHCHMVLSLRPVLFGIGLPTDAVPVLLACILTIPVVLVLLCMVLRDEVRSEVEGGD